MRVAGQFFLKPWHSNQHQTDPPAVKDIPHLLKPGDFEPICFVNDQQSCGVTHAVPYSHRAIPLLIEHLLGVVSFGASITIWVPLGVT